QRTTARVTAHAQQVFEAADRVERLAVDARTRQLEYTITRDARLIDSWRVAGSGLATQTARLRRLATTPVEQGHVERVIGMVASYVNDYSAPVIDQAQRGDAAASSVATMREGDRRIEQLHAELRTLGLTERDMMATRLAQAEPVARTKLLAVDP